MGETTLILGAGIGGAVAGLCRGNFYAEPAPAVKLHMPGPHWHFARVLLE